MSESNLAGYVARRTGLGVNVCTAVLRGMADVIYKEWSQGRSVNLPGVGTIVPSYRKPRIVSSNLPNRVHRRYNIGLRKTARLRPAPTLMHEEPFTGYEVPAAAVGKSFTFISL